MKFEVEKWLVGVATVLVACLPLASFAEPYFTNKEGDLVWDKATNLVWQRCSVGQTWDGATCAGIAQKFTAELAQKQAIKGWNVPTARQLSSLFYCTSSYIGFPVDVRDGGPVIPHRCASGQAQPAINTLAFPATLPTGFWSSSLNFEHQRAAWRVDFGGGGYVGSYYGNLNSLVRLVRASQSSGGEAMEFPLNLYEFKRIAESKSPEDRKSKAQRGAAEYDLIAAGAQAIYLQAGRAQRNGTVTIDGISFTATELYEMIIDKFPASEFAVKASDQLTVMDRAKR